MAGQGVRIYLGYPAGCEVSDADSRKVFGDGYQAAGGAHREILQRLYDKVKNTQGVLPNCGRTPYFYLQQYNFTQTKRPEVRKNRDFRSFFVQNRKQQKSLSLGRGVELVEAERGDDYQA